MKALFFAFLCASYLCSTAQDTLIAVDRAKESASLITAELISKHLHVLAAPEMEGRETGTPGNRKAAEYIAEQFKAAGIPPVPSLNGYFQQVEFSNVSLDEASLSIHGSQFSNLRDFVVSASSLPQDELVYRGSEVIFLGYGIDDKAYSDYTGADVKGKAILIYKGEPVDATGKSRITGSTQMSIWSTGLADKLRAAKKHGVAIVFVVEDQFRAKVTEERMAILGGHTLMGKPQFDNADLAPHALLSSTTVESLLGKKSPKVIKARDRIREKGKVKAVKVPVEIAMTVRRKVKTTPGVNVLGFIEGTDPGLKNEVVIVSAHYDHLGKRGDDIFHGADDNGSGTSGVISIASAFAEAKRKGYGPKRSVLCLLVTGEEKGLLGSEYYSEFPVFPLENTVADVNIDMIGRVDEHHTDTNYTYVIGADRLSSELHEINEDVNARYTKLHLDYTYNAPDDPNRFYYRSDHYNFAKNGIPAIFYFSGVHEDYHRPTDTVDKILFGKAAQIAQLAFYTTWELANRAERIKVNRS